MPFCFSIDLPQKAYGLYASEKNIMTNKKKTKVQRLHRVGLQWHFPPNLSIASFISAAKCPNPEPDTRHQVVEQ